MNLGRATTLLIASAAIASCSVTATDLPAVVATVTAPPPVVATSLPATVAAPTATATQPAALAGEPLALEIVGKYLMAFHACEMSACMSGPRNHLTYLAQSDDGEHWSLVNGWQPIGGSVPDVIRRGNTLYIFNPGQLTRYYIDIQRIEGPVPVQIEGAPDGFVDPSLIVDDDGKLVLFFLFGRPGSDPASCPAGQDACLQQFGSATEVDGSDGTQFTLDDGLRASVEISPAGAWPTASDPDIFRDRSQYVLYISHGPSISVWTSPELRGTYTNVTTPLKGSVLTQGFSGVPSGHYDSSSQMVWSYGHRPFADSATAIVRAVHDGYASPLNENDWQVVISGEQIGLGITTNVESPGVAPNTP